MWDWTGWQTTGQTAWDWGTKVGLGGIVGWFLQRWVGKRDKLADRGQQLVDAARPELVPMGNFGGQYLIQISVENHGAGIARTQRIGFTGVPSIPTVDQVPVGQSRLTAGITVQGSPLFDPASDGHAHIFVWYTDKFDNEYRLSIPVTRQPRADGGFNPDVQWQSYENSSPKLSKARLRGIGGS